MNAARTPAVDPSSPDVDHEAVRRARGRVAERVTELIGHTPLVRLTSFDRDLPGVEIWAKCEFMNPGGSVKDRAAKQMIDDALAAGTLTKDRIIIDSSSGNTGIAYSLIGGTLGYKVTLVLPGNVSWARRRISEAFGTDLVFSSPMEGSDGAIVLCRNMVDADPDRYFYPNQYGNESNPRGHQRTTAPEIWSQTQGRVTHFVTGIGTTGTVMGTGRGLRAFNPNVEVWAVEPDDALHGLEGLKHMESSIVPEIYHPNELSGVIAMPTDEAWDVCERLSQEEGILVGHSSGGNVAGALRIGRKLAAQGKTGVVVTVFPDRADRYFEAPLPTQTRPAPEKAAANAAPAHPAIAPAALAALYEHARRDYPNECCGLVFGAKTTNAADRALACRNIQNDLHAEDPTMFARDARTAYNFDAADIFKLQKSLRGAEPAKIIYHSHCDVGAYFSDTDQAAARMGDEPSYPVEYVVIDVRRDGVQGAVQFAWDDTTRSYVEVKRYASTP